MNLNFHWNYQPTQSFALGFAVHKYMRFPEVELAPCGVLFLGFGLLIIGRRKI